MKKEQKTAAEKALHTPNMIPLKKVFEAVAKGKLYDFNFNEIEYAEELQTISKELISNCYIECDWPLQIKGIIGTKSKERIQDENIEIDLPEFLVYSEVKGGYWQLNKCSTMYEIECKLENEYKKKSCRAVVVLKDGQPMPFYLVDDSAKSLTMINKEQSHECKKRRILWR